MATFSASTASRRVGPGHPEYGLLQQVRQGVAALDAQAGRAPDESSERLTASVMALARQSNLERADHIVLSVQTADSAAGRTVFVVQGDLDDPAHRRASMPTDVAVQTPVAQSLQQLDVAGAERQQAAVHALDQQRDAQARENPAVRMGQPLPGRGGRRRSQFPCRPTIPPAPPSQAIRLCGSA